MKKETLTYAQAVEKLEEIVNRLEAGETSVDELAAAVKEGVALVRWCRRKLKTAQEEVETALAGLDGAEAEADPDTPHNRAPRRRLPTTNAESPGLFAEGDAGTMGEEGLEPPASSV